MRFAVPFLILLFSSIAFAVGGGGGGGSGGSGGSSGGGGSSSGCSGLCEIECFDTGGIKLVSQSEQEINATFLETNETFKVTGVWDFNRFVSDEVLFVKKGRYSVNGFAAECPGFKFSCFTAGITIGKCARHESYVDATFTTRNFDTLDKLKYEFKVGNNYYYYTKELHSGQVKSLSLMNITNNTYFINATVDGAVTHVQLSDKRCAIKTILECLPPKAEGKPESRTFLCSDLPTLQERVRCRLELDEAQREQELRIVYLPEECRALEGEQRESCIKIYDSVQRCWPLPQGEARVNCVKGVLGFTTIGDEKNKCGQNSTCIENIKNNVFTLIKFRFYDLEERAEELYSKNPALVASVVSSLEAKKQEFNAAQTLEEKKQIVLQVREIWKNFVEEVKK